MFFPYTGLPKGSSPLTRGAPTQLLHRGTQVRLIPAHAGSTKEKRYAYCDWWAHPRSRGEHVPLPRKLWRRWGSSPLTRGAHPQRLTLRPRTGLIPAHAGSTSSADGGGRPEPAHPRSRGEHRLVLPARRWRRGSSPLTRGARWSAGPVPGRPGLIPAHAGSTSIRFLMRSPPPAHPRSRGEHMATRVTVVEVNGSSPLTRGAHSYYGCGE